MLLYCHGGDLNMNDINLRFKELRKSLGKSQKEIGDAIGLSNSGISNIENGQRNVTDKHIKLLVSEFSINGHWLRTGEGEMLPILSESQELAAYCGDLCRGKDPFVANLVLQLSRLNIDDIQFICDLIKNLANFDEKK